MAMAMTLAQSEGNTGFIGRIPVRNLWRQNFWQKV